MHFGGLKCTNLDTNFSEYCYKNKIWSVAYIYVHLLIYRNMDLLDDTNMAADTVYCASLVSVVQISGLNAKSNAFILSWQKKFKKQLAPFTSNVRAIL